MRQVLALVFVAGLLSGCIGSLGAHAKAPADRTVDCPCPQDRALSYAVLAAKELGMNPTIVNPTGFNVVQQDMIVGAVYKRLDIILKPVDNNKTQVIVQARSSGDQEVLANEYVAAFKKVSN